MQSGFDLGLGFPKRRRQKGNGRTALFRKEPLCGTAVTPMQRFLKREFAQPVSEPAVVYLQYLITKNSGLTDRVWTSHIR